MDKRKKCVLDESRFRHVNDSAKCDIRVKYLWPIVRSVFGFFLTNIYFNV